MPGDPVDVDGPGRNKSGFDIPLTRAVSDALRVPVIASAALARSIAGRGFATARHRLLAASIFHFGTYRIRAKARLAAPASRCTPEYDRSWAHARPALAGDQSRRGTDPQTSYTARLFSRGRAKIAQKLGEEAVEAVIEGVRDNPSALVGESADLLYHLLVLWADAGISPADVAAELTRRDGTSGIDEKRARANL